MKATPKPYPLPATPSADLARVLDYWRGLLRGSAEIPFSDDLSLENLPDLGDRLGVIDVFEKPERFRVASLGAQLAADQSSPVADKFLDEVSLYYPLEFLRSQCSATMEAGAPTCHSQGASADGLHAGYDRLVLPLWGNGYINMLLVVVDWH